MNYSPDIGRRIFLTREERKLTTTALGGMVGVSHASILNWEKGAVDGIKASNWMALCDALQVRPDWLWNGKGSRDKRLSDKARALAELYDSLPDHQQEQLATLAETIRQQADPRPSPSAKTLMIVASRD